MQSAEVGAGRSRVFARGGAGAVGLVGYGARLEAPLLLLMFSCKTLPPAAPAAVDLGTVTANQVVEGFRVEAVYTAGMDPVGVRLEHEHTGMELHLLHRDTVPQAYVWVHTVPDSDRGEPHTQEHLLLGKGNRGRAVSTAESMSLVTSSAFTDQHQTVYHFRTNAGTDMFFDVFGQRIDALLHPDYLDEEIRREVHHWGVSETAEGLALEEKGTVYNEMDSSTQRPGWALWSQMPKDLYGPEHPQSFESGGLPEALRTLGVDHIRAFHAATHQLGNMGAIVFLPDTVPLTAALSRLDDSLTALEPEPGNDTWITDADLPPPQPSEDRSVRHVSYPNPDASGEATVTVSWPPTLDLGEVDEALMGLLTNAVAGDESSNLYKALIDSATRERDVGASSVWAWQSDDQGNPLIMQVGGIPSQDLDAPTVEWIADRLQQAWADVAALDPASEAYADLQRRLQSTLITWRRSTLDEQTGPPGFGTRGTGTAWYDIVRDLDERGGFHRDLLHGKLFATLEAELARTDVNIWTQRLEDHKILAETPFVFVNRPDPAKLAALSAAKEARAADKLVALRAELGIDDEQEALRAFQVAYDADTAALEAAVVAPEVRFLDAPPMEADADLDVTHRTLGEVDVIAGRFDAMGGAKGALYLDLSGTDPAHGMWLSALPALLGQVGVIVDGEPLAYESVIDRLRREVLTARLRTSTNARTGRAELAASVGGIDPVETRAAVSWVTTFLTAPDWRVENLPRIRDLVDQRLTGVRRRMLGSEESWTDVPEAAWRWQQSALQLHLWSFLTAEHDLVRMKYRLATPDPATTEALRALGAASLDRPALEAVLAAWQGREVEVPRTARRLVPKSSGEALARAGLDLERSAAALPDDTLAADVAYLCARMSADLEENPADALAELDALRAGLLRAGGARVAIAGGAMLDTLDADLAPLLGVLQPGEAPAVARDDTPRIRARIADRGGNGAAVHAGLSDPNRRSGVARMSAPLTRLEDTDDDSVLDYLAFVTMSGGGAHALFIRTWGAGLAYSNGSRASEFTGRSGWSAERCPKLAQTVSFVNDTVQGTQIDLAIAEYAVAEPFWTRTHSSYRSRVDSYAEAMVDGDTPERVRAFREAVLAQRDRPNLAEELASRVVGLYANVMPGLGDPPPADAGATSFVIGDAAQLDAWSVWLDEQGEGTLQVIYPRDFWVVAPVDTE